MHGIGTALACQMEALYTASAYREDVEGTKLKHMDATKVVVRRELASVRLAHSPGVGRCTESTTALVVVPRVWRDLQFILVQHIVHWTRDARLHISRALPHIANLDQLFANLFCFSMPNFGTTAPQPRKLCGDNS